MIGWLMLNMTKAVFYSLENPFVHHWGEEWLKNDGDINKSSLLNKIENGYSLCWIIFHERKYHL